MVEVVVVVERRRVELRGGGGGGGCAGCAGLVERGTERRSDCGKEAEQGPLTSNATNSVSWLSPPLSLSLSLFLSVSHAPAPYRVQPGR